MIYWVGCYAVHSLPKRIFFLIFLQRRYIYRFPVTWSMILFLCLLQCQLYRTKLLQPCLSTTFAFELCLIQFTNEYTRSSSGSSERAAAMQIAASLYTHKVARQWLLHFWVIERRRFVEAAELEVMNIIVLWGRDVRLHEWWISYWFSFCTYLNWTLFSCVCGSLAHLAVECSLIVS